MKIYKVTYLNNGELKDINIEAESIKRALTSANFLLRPYNPFEIVCIQLDLNQLFN